MHEKCIQSDCLALQQHKMDKFCVAPDDRYVAFRGAAGCIHLLSGKVRLNVCVLLEIAMFALLQTYELLHSFKMNAELADFVFAPDGVHLYSHGADGEVYVWDLRARECSHKFVDEGCVKGTSLDVSADGRFIACGYTLRMGISCILLKCLLIRSNTGVVNVYERPDVLRSSEPKPVRALMNLTTPVTQVRFAPTSEMLGMCSEHKEKAMRIVGSGSGS